MTYIFISPNYPAGHWKYVAALRAAGHTVLGLGDAGFETFPAELRGNLDEYYRVSDLHNYDEVYRAVGYYISRWGRIDNIESLNPYWSDLVFSLCMEFMLSDNTTSEQYEASVAERMECGLLPPSVVFTTIDAAVKFGEEMGYPLLAVPAKNKRLGSRMIAAEAGLRNLLRGEKKGEWVFFAQYPGVPVSVDGLYALDDTGENGIKLCAVHVYTSDGAMYCLPNDEAVCEKAYHLAEHTSVSGFFHICGVKLAKGIPGVGKKGDIVFNSIEDAPPHEYIIECMNAEFGQDIRALWAGMRSQELAGAAEQGSLIELQPTGCAAVAFRSFEQSYKNYHEKILRKLNIKLIAHGKTSEADQQRYMDYYYIFSGENAAELRRSIKYVTEDFKKCQ